MTENHTDRPAKPFAARFLNRALHLLARYLPVGSKIRITLHRLRGVKIGRGVFIGEEVFIESEYPECVEIGDNVQIAVRTVVMAHLKGPGRVVIENQAYIGPCCVIAAANSRTIRVGEGAVVGALSLITKDVPSHTFVRPPAPVCAASVAIPLPLAANYPDFLRGLGPTKNRK